MNISLTVIVVVGPQTATRIGPSRKGLVIWVTWLRPLRMVSSMTPSSLVIDALVTASLCRVQTNATRRTIGRPPQITATVLPTIRRSRLSTLPTATRVSTITPHIMGTAHPRLAT